MKAIASQIIDATAWIALASQIGIVLTMVTFVFLSRLHKTLRARKERRN